MLEFKCPHCSQVLNIPEQFIGSTGTCRKCGGSITIEPQTCMNSDGTVSFAERPPTLIALHVETTGPSARKCNIIELASVKFTLDGQETDSFFSFAHPGHMIPPRISEKNGITDEMVAGAPSSVEVVKQWCAWAGPQVLLVSNHGHFDAKFIAAAYLRDDLDPPQAFILDLMDWAEVLDIPIKAYKLRVLLDHIGHRVKKAAHRALETCHGQVAAAHYLIKKDAGTHLENDPLLGRLAARHEAVNADQAWKILQEQSKTLEEMCGPGYFDKVRQEARRTRTQRSGIPVAMAPENDGLKHSSAWYAERGRHISQMMFNADATRNDPIPEHAPWEYVLLEASQTPDRAEQIRLCQQAVDMGAIDPWPYERLVHVYIKSHDYEAAQSVCEKYFETSAWKVGRWAETSLKLLKRLEKLERKLAEARA